MLNQQISTKTEPILDIILALSPKEQFQLIVILLQRLLGIQNMAEIRPHIATARLKTVDQAVADFWPEDESVDDFLTFTYQQRQENLVK